MFLYEDIDYIYTGHLWIEFYFFFKRCVVSFSAHLIIPPLSGLKVEKNKESTETYLLELTPYTLSSQLKAL